MWPPARRVRRRAGDTGAVSTRAVEPVEPIDLIDLIDLIKDRKREHVELALADASQALTPAGWDDVSLVSAALPEVSTGDIDLSLDFVGRRLSAPVAIAAMTGGHDDAVELNAALGAAAAQLGLAVGVGSQRAGLADGSLERSFSAIRDRAPQAVVIGNIGACQLVEQRGALPLTRVEVLRLVEMISADALAVHLNVVQELVQTEGDRNFDALADAIATLVHQCPVPVIVKETGAGMSRADAEALAATGVAAIDVGGAGGTSFARIEAGRAARIGDERGTRLGATFANWGIPTAASVLEVRGCGVPVVATGGIRNGLDAAKALALGATVVGIGRPAMVAAQRGEAALVHELELVLEELRTALLLCGARTPADLPAPVLSGFTLEWSKQRGLATPDT